jgi:hypothetical protein
MLRPQVRVSRGTFSVLAILLLAPPAPGQGRCPQSPSRWPAAIAVASIATAAAIDARADRHYVAHRTSTLDRLADAGNTIGAGHFVEPVLGAALLSSVLLRRAAPSLWRDALTVTIAYAVASP